MKAQRKWKKAYHFYQQAIELFTILKQPYNEARLLNNIARLKIETNELVEATKYSNKALAIFAELEISEEQAETLFDLSTISLEQGNFSEARDLLIKALQFDPENCEASIRLSIVLLALNDLSSAKSHCQVCLGHDHQWELTSTTDFDNCFNLLKMHSMKKKLNYCKSRLCLIKTNSMKQRHLILEKQLNWS